MPAVKQSLESETYEKLGAEYRDYMENVSDEDWLPPYKLLTVADRPRNAKTQTPFNGITNTLFPTLMQIKRGYPSNEWATYKQWQGMGAQVRKGEKGIPIIKVVQRLKKDAKDENDTYTALMVYTEFNAAQVDGYTPQVLPERVLPPMEERLEKADAFIKAQGAKMTVGDPAYIPAYDVVAMPMRQHFHEVDTGAATPDEHRVSVFLHELAHRTGHPTRLDRKILNRFGTSEYAREEMTAQTAAIRLQQHIGVTPSEKPLDYDVAYMKGWFTEALRKDPSILEGIMRDAVAAERYMIDQHERYKADPSIIERQDELPEVDTVKRPQAVAHEPINLKAALAGGIQTVDVDREIYFNEPGSQWTDRPGGPTPEPFEIPNKVWGTKQPETLPEIIHDKVPEHHKPGGGDLENPTADQLWIEKPGIRKEPQTVDELLEDEPNRKSFTELVNQQRGKAKQTEAGKGAA